MTRAVLLIAALLASAGCERKKPEVGGLGPWRFSQSKRSGVKSGRCDPHTAQDGRVMTWCHQVTPLQIAGRPGEIDLYFLGPPEDQDARLIEIQLKIRGCNEAELDKFMRQYYGAPYETKGEKSYYQNSFLWAAAFMPSAPGRCLVHFLPLSEEAEIARIKQK